MDALLVKDAGVEVDTLVLRRTPESLDKDVAHPSPLAIHADPDAVAFKDAGELVAGGYGPTINAKTWPSAASHQNSGWPWPLNSTSKPH